MSNKCWPIAVMIVASVCAAAGFLSSFVFWLTTVGVAIWLKMQFRDGSLLKRSVSQYFSSVLALSIAFFWAPDAMAYAMDASFWAGLGVAFMVVSFEALRITLPIVAGCQLARSARAAWFASGLLAVVVETWFPSVFPWRLGYPLVEMPMLVQAADFLGPSFPTFLTFTIAGVVINTIDFVTLVRKNKAVKRLRRPQLVGYAVPALLLVASLAYAAVSSRHWRSRETVSPSIKVALCQVYPMDVDSVERARDLSSRLPRDLDLICWPESIGGTYSRKLKMLDNQSLVFQNSLEPERGLQPWPEATSPLLVGGKTFEGSQQSPDATFVSALLIEPQQQGIVGVYDKRKLMPFGEYVPMKDYFPFMDSIFGQWDEITPGTDAGAICLDETQIGVFLCYEDMVPDIVRETVVGSADLLISLADGSSFESPSTRRQHRLLAQLRAVENRKYLLRCASTGETCVISPTGQIVSRLPLDIEDALLASVPLLGKPSVYTTCGDMFPWAALGGLLALGFVQLHQARASRL